MTTSREILNFLARKDYRPMRRRSLARALGVHRDDYDEFRQLINELEREGDVRAGRGRRYSLVEEEEIDGIPGVFINKGDYGFFRPDDGNEDYYVGRGDTAGAMNDDQVLLEARRSRGPRLAGRVVRITKRARNEIVGILKDGFGSPYIMTGKTGREESGVEVSLPAGTKNSKLPFGHKVTGRIKSYPTATQPAKVELGDDLGPAGTIEAETAAVICEYNLREEFPAAALAEAEELPHQLSAAEVKGRVDYRQQRCITVDPPDAADFDDAVCLEKIDTGWRLYVHIADVAWAVPADKAIDTEARKRSTSVYLPGHVIPMLPPRLSSGLCSLRPDEDRPVQTAVIDYNPDGRRLGYRIERAVIRSALRLNYAQVRRLIEGTPQPGEEVPEWAIAALKDMQKFSQILRRDRFKAGAIFLDMPEIRIRVGDNGETLGIEERRQDFSHQIVEEFMLAANRAVGDYLVRNELPGLFRNHDAPEEDKLRELSSFVRTFGLSFKAPFSRRNLQKLVTSIEGTENAPIIMFAVLTSMKQACYSAKAAEHFALAFEPYCHFTSPIRRYPDLVVHRALTGMYHPGNPVLQGPKVGGRRKKKRAQVYDRTAAQAQMEMLASHCSRMERNAAEAERRLTRFRQMELLERNLEAEHTGEIIKVTDFGLFVRLRDFYVEGLVLLSSMNDHYSYNSKRQELLGQRTGRRWRRGDIVEVRITELDSAMGRLDLELV